MFGTFIPPEPSLAPFGKAARGLSSHAWHHEVQGAVESLAYVCGHMPGKLGRDDLSRQFSYVN
ncbi:protein of unknown function (plasmid) [Caballeronia sp. S22]